MSKEPAQRISGIIPPMFTPLTENFNLDVKGTEKLVNHLIAGGVHGIFILGSTGEASSLSYAVRKDLIARTCEFVADRIPVMVGITDTSFAESVTLAKVAESSGATAVVAAPPFYFNLSQQELLEYYIDLADNVPLPLLLYNMPSLTKVYIELETVIALSAHPKIIGLKDSSADMVYFQSLIYATKSENFALLVGPEEITAEAILMGGHGGVNGGANLFPRLYVKMYEAAVQNDLKQIRYLQTQIMEVGFMLYRLGNYGSSYLKGIKGAAQVLGICEKYVAPPFKPFLEREMAKVAENLKVINRHLEEIL